MPVSARTVNCDGGRRGGKSWRLVSRNESSYDARMFELQPWQWALAAGAAFLVGLSKTGIPGVGVLTVAIFANVFPARESTGILLPLLVCADIVAVTAYRQHAVWSHLWRLFPWVVVGVVAGFLMMDRIDDAQVRRLIGGILIVMVALHVWRQRRLDGGADRAIKQIPHTLWFAAIVGALGGFTTMVANAAGPIMILYMLAMGLPKMEFMGTGAWYFFLLNVFKLPFSYQLGLLSRRSLLIDAALVVMVIAGALWGKKILPRINQKLFAGLALVFTVLAALRLLLQ
jgi:uncharacterized membrane protein YfcA